MRYNISAPTTSRTLPLTLLRRDSTAPTCLCAFAFRSCSRVRDDSGCYDAPWVQERQQRRIENLMTRLLNHRLDCDPPLEPTLDTHRTGAASSPRALYARYVLPVQSGAGSIGGGGGGCKKLPNLSYCTQQLDTKEDQQSAIGARPIQPIPPEADLHSHFRFRPSPPACRQQSSQPANRPSGSATLKYSIDPLCGYHGQGCPPAFARGPLSQQQLASDVRARRRPDQNRPTSQPASRPATANRCHPFFST